MGQTQDWVVWLRVFLQDKLALLLDNPSQVSDSAQVMASNGYQGGGLGTSSGGFDRLSGVSLGTKRRREIRESD